MEETIRLICTRCGRSGDPASDTFADLSGLLDFEPVPRQVRRKNGWHPQTQRAFIAALVTGGSVNKACRIVDREPNGVRELRRHPQAGPFARAWDRALKLFEERENSESRAEIALLMDEQLARLDARSSAQPSPNPEGQAVAADPDSEAARRTLADQLLARYAVKLRHERAARRAGRLTEADFTLRQLTFLEVALDLASPDLFAEIARLERDGHALLDIADTWASRLLLAERRKAWAEAGDPATPDPWPDQALAAHPGLRTEPPEHIRGGGREELQAQEDTYRQAHAAAAARVARLP